LSVTQFGEVMRAGSLGAAGKGDKEIKTSPLSVTDCAIAGIILSPQKNDTSGKINIIILFLFLVLFNKVGSELIFSSFIHSIPM
ncbi:hypothetical protein, partial [Salmonella enterica]|uniref:hypothetical protein n=1 Tax=Salmonella enterica TaxID=28901 RepID=UPI001592392C